MYPPQSQRENYRGFNLSFPFEKPRNPDEEAFFIALAQLCAQALERVRLNVVEQKDGL